MNARLPLAAHFPAPGSDSGRALGPAELMGAGFALLADPVLVVDSAERIVIDANDCARRLLPLTDPLPLLDLIHPRDRVGVVARLAGLHDGGASERLEFRLRGAEGDMRWHDWQASRHGQLLLLVGRDVHERREAEDLWRMRQKQLTEAQRIARLGDWHWQRGTRSVTCSVEFLRIMAMPDEASQIGLLDIWQAVHPEDRAGLRRALVGAIRRHSSFNLTFRLPRRDGSTGILWVDGHCEFDAGGEVIGLFGIAQDQTEQQESERNLRDAKEAAEMASTAKSQFLANMSHELRTPLNAIIGFSEVMEAQLLGPLPEKYHGYAKNIRDSGAHLLELINDVLDMSKIEAGKYQLSIEPTPAAELIQDTVRLIEGRFEESGVELRVDAVSPHAVMDCDRRAVKQILLNLLSNAVKFTHRGGTVSVYARSLPESFEISVADTGFGIPEDQLLRITKPFEQVDTDYSKRSQGTGLGLAITKSLVELHGGSFTLESQIGIGTQITFSLPRMGRPPAAEPAEPGGVMPLPAAFLAGLDRDEE